MPLFEFRCEACAKRFTFLTGVIAENSEPACPRCGSVQLKKLISRVARGRSEDDRMDALADKLDGTEMEALIEAEANGDEESFGAGAMGGGDDGTIY